MAGWRELFTLTRRDLLRKIDDGMSKEGISACMSANKEYYDFICREKVAEGLGQQLDFSACLYKDGGDGNFFYLRVQEDTNLKKFYNVQCIKLIFRHDDHVELKAYQEERQDRTSPLL
tara:strand:- start:210 stop:563 length:354 start_codon:yes stop_codon:yes gene_type:complete